MVNSKDAKLRESGGLLSLFWAVVLLIVGVAAGCSEDEAPLGPGNTPDTTGAGLVSSSDFTSAEDCRSCHMEQYDEWSGSMHAYSLKDPVWNALNREGQKAYVGALDQGCVKCHGMIGSRAGEMPWGGFEMDSLPAVVQEGVTCDLCHTISGITAIENANLLLAPGEVKYGTIVNPVATNAHKSEYQPLYKTSEYCGACHDIIVDKTLGLETTFAEWQNGGFAATGKTCNDCHMPTYTGSAAPGAPVRTLHRHTFIGTDLAFIDFPQKAEQLRLVTELLQNAVTMNVITPSSAAAGAQIAFQVELINDKTGHDVPSGASFLRQVWLDVTVRDASGSLLFSSGQLDANDDLMDEESKFPQRDSSLFNLQSVMRRADGSKTMLTWDVYSLDNPALHAGQTQLASYAFDVPPLTTGPLSINATLRYRSFPPWVIRSLDLESVLPITIIDMNIGSATVPLQ